ncbi:MAG: hypothetical protein HY593_00920 [Candidatus Omnitrophica bacterium]|nr:hypothetical protein [Candidatus Omnitrophota bacterium]
MISKGWVWGVGAGLLLLNGLALEADAQETSERSKLRISAYAPPVIPHEADLGDCLDCHASHEVGAPMIPHKVFAHCRQCHVPQSDVDVFRANAFVGIREPGKLPRAHEKAPPAVPHRVFMRENCLACHDPEARPDVIHTTHPQRMHCLQCHVPARRLGALDR